MKQILTLFFCLTLSSALWSNVVIDGIYYVFRGNEAAVVSAKTTPTSPNTYSDNIIIPEHVTYNGNVYPVTRIDNEAFSSCSSLRSVTIPNSVRFIGEKAFCGSTALQSVRFGGGIRTIEKQAFSGCTALTHAILPKGLRTIGSATFHDCRQLSKLYLGDSLISIGEGAFSTCSELRNVTFPKTLRQIEAQAFMNCIHLETLTLPENLESMGNSAFRGCTNLQTIYLGSKLKSIPAYCFAECYDLHSITIGIGVQTIGAYAFKNCSSLRSTRLPKSVTKIENGAFHKCTMLSYLIIEGNTPPILGEDAFADANSNLQIQVESTNNEQWKESKQWRMVGNNTYMPASGTTPGTKKDSGSPSPSPGNTSETTNKTTQKTTKNTTTGTTEESSKNNSFEIMLTCNEHGAVAGGGTYKKGQKITILAAPRKGYRFIKWSDGNREAARDVVATHDWSLTAIFEKEQTDSPQMDSPRRNDSTQTPARKVEYDGNLYIQKNGKLYNVLGVEVKKK